MIFTLWEIIDVVIMSLFVGFIFSDAFRRPSSVASEDPLAKYRKRRFSFGFDWQSLRFAIYVTAPALILHELAHKFTALYFGMQAVFHAAYTWLMIGLLLKLINFGFIFFVPAYVEISGTGTALQYALTAFAGPFMNLVLWIVPLLILRSKLAKKMNKKVIVLLHLTKQINMFLFIFNMLPIPMFDGFKVYAGLWQTFFP